MQALEAMELVHSVATEDGSLGSKRLVTDLLEQGLMTQGREPTAIYTWRPAPMMARAAQIAAQFNLLCQALWGARMACGMGACLGCAVKVRG